MPSDGRPESRLGRFVREPTVLFVVGAALLFLIARIFGPGGADVIEISQDDLEWRILQAELAQGAPLSEDARRQVESAYIDEQVLVREALALGLEDDERIDDILAQKMLHVLSGEVIQPTRSELERYYASNIARYTPEATVAVDEVVVPLDAPDVEELPGELRDGVPPEDLVGGVLLSHRVMPTLTGTDITQLFSAETAGAAMSAEPGSWVGPHLTVRGAHWLRVNDRADADPLPLDAVLERVRLDWIAEREEARLAEEVAELRAQYEVRIVEDGEDEP